MLEMAQDTGKFRQNTKDQYYTKPEIAKFCIDTLLRICPESISSSWVEPSAGAGGFLRAVPCQIQTIGLDIDPKAPGIQKADFLTWSPPSDKKIVCFGNPPFGRQGSLAKAFLKHASEFSDILAFILPRSFGKPSMTRGIPLLFHCLHSEELPSKAFLVNEEEYDVPCVFQIWKKKDTERPLSSPIQPSGFLFCKQSDSHHLILRRVGVFAGRVFLSGSATYNPQTHYFLRLDEKYRSKLSNIVQKLNNHTFPTNTTGPRSLSKSEVSEVLNQILYSESS